MIFLFWQSSSQFTIKMKEMNLNNPWLRERKNVETISVAGKETSSSLPSLCVITRPAPSFSHFLGPEEDKFNQHPTWALPATDVMLPRPHLETDMSNMIKVKDYTGGLPLGWRLSEGQAGTILLCLIKQGGDQAWPGLLPPGCAKMHFMSFNFQQGSLDFSNQCYHVAARNSFLTLRCFQDI